MAKTKSKKYLDTNGVGEEKKFEVRVQRLARAWQKRQEEPLKNRQKLLALWASGYYDAGYSREHLINLMDRGVFTIVPYLVEGNPKIMVESLPINYRSWAYTTQLALNFLIEKMNLAESVFIPAAINSMFGAGIVRTFTEFNRVFTIDDEVIKSGTPSIRVIDDVDYIGDIAAKSRVDYAFEGDVYKLPTEYARDLFSKYADDIMPDCKLSSDYAPEKISNGEYDINRLSLRDYTTFMDIYFYDEGVTKTIMPYGKKAEFLHEVEEDGPGESPYDFLGYKFFPGTTYPIPPAWFWHDLDVSLNIVARTSREQAESQKDIIFIDSGAKDIGNKIKSAKNLDIIPLKDPVDSAHQISFGGMNPAAAPWMGFVEDNFNKAGGTAEVMRGGGAEADTLGQTKIIFQNASRIINNMHTRYQDFMTKIIKKLAWRVWTDPTVYVPVIKKIPGVTELPEVFSQADKVGDFYDFIFKIVPYSTQRMSPEQKYQRLMQISSQWVLPTLQIAAQQGGEFDIPEATKRMAEYIGLDDFNQLYHSAIPKEGDIVPYQMQPLGAKTTKSPGQQNDAFGSLIGSREANMGQQQTRTENKENVI